MTATVVVSTSRMNEQAIAAAQTHWALNHASATLIAERENHVYRVDTPNGTVALRVHRPGYRRLVEIEAELLWMDTLASNGLAVPKPVPAIDGRYLITSDGLTLSVLSWLDGTPWSQFNPTPEHFHRLGCELARMHTIADNWVLPATFERPTWDLVGSTPTWGKFWENPMLSNTDVDSFTRFRNKARVALSQMPALDVGLIHADLVPDNVLSYRDELQFIDFDDGGFGYRLFDLATITYQCRQRQPNGALAAALINGYKIHRPIEDDSLLLFEALRACSYVGWNITRMHEPGGPERNTRFTTSALEAIERASGFF
jgi:Ser/Thr protein kinase RdoA (MazF antagonist)